VVAYYYDQDKAERIPVNVLAPGETTGQAPKFTLRHDYRDATAAHDAAEAKLATLQRGVGTLSLTLPGVPQLRADQLLTLTGLREGIDGEWYVTRAEHQLDQGGYVTRIEAEVPK
jgi:phage protein D